MTDPHSTQMIENVAQGILEVAKKEEEKLDAKLKALEELDEDDFEAIRQKRKQQLQKKMQQEQVWKHLGHGVYSELTDTKEFFEAAKKSQRLVVHFYRSVTPRCQIVDAHLHQLAQKHLEARFVKIDVEKSPYLVEKLGIILMPTVVLVKDGKTEHSIRGFDEMGGVDDFSTTDFAYVLSQHGMINFDGGDRSEDIGHRFRKAGVNSMRMNVRRGGFDDIGSDED
mmetsp:Transcript_27076/g.29531  ORF Transcript_27076/g.29531 Transcript_27076/m.29531 type:complete len:225 (+) Transcript_27076:81-755(+)|eukprot:gene8149-8813_t